MAPLAFGSVVTYTRPAIATDGEVYIAVWRDTRDGVNDATYGARIDANGHVLDPVGIRLLEGPGGGVVAFGDGRYLVVNGLLDFAIVDREANVVARGRIADELGSFVRVVFNGRDFVVFWGYNNVRVTTVGGDGHVGEIGTIVPATAETWLNGVATNGSRIVALYMRGVELHAALTSLTGAPVSDNVIAPSVSSYSPATIAGSNDGFVAAWVPLAGSGVVAARLDANGALAQEPTVVAAEASSPELVASGGAYRLFTVEGERGAKRVVGRSLGHDLSASAPLTVLERLPHTVDFLAAAAGPGGTLALADFGHEWMTVLDDGVWAVDGDVASEPQIVSRAAHTQLDPSVAVGEEGTFVTWSERGSIRSTYFPRAGTPSTFDVSASSATHSSVAAQGSTYLVAWQGADGPRVRLYRGAVAVGDSLNLGEGGYWPVAASDGRDFVVAWTWLPTREVRVARINTSGAVIATYAIPYANYNGIPEPALACDRGECLVVFRNQVATWTCPRILCVDLDERVMGVRLDSSLAPIDATPLVLSDRLSGVRLLAAAADDGAYAVSWVEDFRVNVRTIGRDGEASPAIDVAGERHALARQDGAWLLVRELGQELIVTRLRDGSLPYEFALVRDAQTRSAPALAKDGTDVLAVYERTTRGEAAGGVPRIHLAPIGPAEARRRAVRK